LERNRDFRREQLARVDLCMRTRTSRAMNGTADQAEIGVPAHLEIEALVAAGARRALADIDLALARMRTGDYGDCRACGASIPLVVLEAIPKTTLCLACQQPAERAGNVLPGV
jgi:DnaK suppressor protein